jgi:hypothetical protein
MWDVPSAAIPGPWLTLPGVPAWLAIAAAAGALAMPVLAAVAAVRTRRRRPATLRRLGGVRAA